MNGAALLLVVAVGLAAADMPTWFRRGLFVVVIVVAVIGRAGGLW